METHNHDEHHVYDGVETQERSEIEDHGIPDKVMASSVSRKLIQGSLEALKDDRANLHETRHPEG